MRYVFVTVLAVALVTSSAAQGQAPPGRDAATLSVATGALRGQQSATVSLSTSSPIAALTVVVPRGFSLDLGRASGARVGQLITVLADAEGSVGAFGDGALVVDDPAR